MCSKLEGIKVIHKFLDGTVMTDEEFHAHPPKVPEGHLIYRVLDEIFKEMEAEKCLKTSAQH